MIGIVIMLLAMGIYLFKKKQSVLQHMFWLVNRDDYFPQF